MYLVVVEASPENIQKASEIIKKDGIVVYPTDTVYGLGCNPFSSIGVRKLIQVKGLRKKPFPILASNFESISKIAIISLLTRKVCEKIWPGPLTIVVQRKNLPKEVTLDKPTVGVRIPNHDVALKLIQLSGGLLVGTSANKTGLPSPRHVLEACRQLGDSVDMFIDGGQTEGGVSSTVVDFSRKKPLLLRKGPISFRAILEIYEETKAEMLR